MDNNGNDRGLGTLSSPQRNNYFYGKLMDVPHFEMEQRYVNKKRWLLNRLGLGSGVLCGLKLSIKEKTICISPGVAIDGYGREIVVPFEVCVDPWTLTDDCGRPGSTPLSNTEPLEVLLCLAYKECQTDFMPVLVTDCNTKQDSLPGTNVESFCLVVQEIPAEGLSSPSGIDPELCKILGSGKSPDEKRQALCRLNPAADCGLLDSEKCVALGTLSLKKNGTIDQNLDQCAMRTVLVSNQHLLDMLLCEGGSGAVRPEPENLTTIKSVSGWTHNGKIALKDFPATLSVQFSGNVTTNPTPVDAPKGAWFIVTLEFPTGAGGGWNMSRLVTGAGSSIVMTSVILNCDDVQLTNNEATFTVAQTFIDAARRLTDDENGEEVEILCRVCVKCDFLLDANGQAVDGNYLGGALPTGDGVQGGDFESWFFVTRKIALQPAPIGPDA